VINQSAEWAALATERARVGDTHLRELFQEDPARGKAMTVEAGDLFLDYSKN
jgi:glucose-6-phosphate isomerase